MFENCLYCKSNVFTPKLRTEMKFILNSTAKVIDVFTQKQ